MEKLWCLIRKRVMVLSLVMSSILATVSSKDAIDVEDIRATIIGKKYPMKYQPEYEDFAMARYFRTRKLVKFQIRCFFYGGPCDIVGRWAKPRVKTGFIGPCIKCTEKQQNWLPDSLNLIAETDPELFRAVIARYIEFYGVTLPLEDRLRVAMAFET